MGRFEWDYFSGANVVLEMDGFPILECAGLTYGITESRRPIYGYSSRHFDTVARGQVLIQGSIVINYVHQDYLITALRRSIELRDERNGVERTEPLPNPHAWLNDPRAKSEALNELRKNYRDNIRLPDLLKEQYWGNPETETVLSDLTFEPNLIDVPGSVSLTVSFGERNAMKKGDTAFQLRNVHFVTRGIGIQIDESTIVEEYGFIARNVVGLRTRKQSFVQQGASQADDSLEINQD